jgi:hypothetical protein
MSIVGAIAGEMPPIFCHLARNAPNSLCAARQKTSVATLLQRMMLFRASSFPRDNSLEIYARA